MSEEMKCNKCNYKTKYVMALLLHHQEVHGTFDEPLKSLDGEEFFVSIETSDGKKAK